MPAEKKLLMEFTTSTSSESDVDSVDTPTFVNEDYDDVVASPASTLTSSSSMINITTNSNKRIPTLFKQLSMKETRREARWENHRRQMIMNRQRERQEFEVKEMKTGSSVRNLTDGDLDELRGSIELGFGFNEEDGGHNLRGTLPALDLYFAVNRQLSDPKLRSFSTPGSMPASAAETPSPSSPREDQRNSDDWKICNPGDNPQAVKTRLRHWAQVVACSVRQIC